MDIVDKWKQTTLLNGLPYSDCDELATYLEQMSIKMTSIWQTHTSDHELDARILPSVQEIYIANKYIDIDDFLEKLLDQSFLYPVKKRDFTVAEFSDELYNQFIKSYIKKHNTTVIPRKRNKLRRNR